MTRYNNIIFDITNQLCNEKSQTGKNRKWVSEWLLFNTNSAIFQPYHGENKWDNDDVHLVLDQTFSWILIVLAHWNNSLRIDMFNCTRGERANHYINDDFKTERDGILY
jgi:hypothetical protein